MYTGGSSVRQPHMNSRFNNQSSGAHSGRWVPRHLLLVALAVLISLASMYPAWAYTTVWFLGNEDDTVNVSGNTWQTSPWYGGRRGGEVFQGVTYGQWAQIATVDRDGRWRSSSKSYSQTVQMVHGSYYARARCRGEHTYSPWSEAEISCAEYR